MESFEPELVDREELLRMFPAFKGRGRKEKHRLDWYIRRRAIPGMVRMGRRIFFNPEKIREWIKENTLPVENKKIQRKKKNGI